MSKKEEGQTSVSKIGSLYRAPRTPVEEVLATIWAQVLDCECVGVEDHFQDLGGTSLHATRIFSRLRDVLGVSLPRSLILQLPTIAQMATYIETSQQASRYKAVVVLAGVSEGQEDYSSFSE